MNLRPYFSQKVKLTDIDGKEWVGQVKTYTPAIDSDDNMEEIALSTKGELISFKENEIKAIKIM